MPPARRLVALAAAVLVTAPLCAVAPRAAVAVTTVPDEPGARILTDEPTVQVAVADLTAEGAPIVLALVRGDRGTLGLRAWAEAAGTWSPIGEGVEVVPGATTPGQGAVSWAAAPALLLVARDRDRDRVLLLRQPAYTEPGLEAECCLLVDEVTLTRGRLMVADAAPITDSVTGAFVLDLDGDGSDELVTTRSLPPLGDIAFPTEVLVYARQDAPGRPLRAPVRTELPVGSGDTPFVLGDSDGRPGEELATIVTLGRPELHRLAARADLTLTVEDAGRSVDAAVGVPVAGGGVLLLEDDGWGLHPWPRNGPLGPAVVAGASAASRVLGVVRDGDGAAAYLAAASRGAIWRVGLDAPHVVDEITLASSRAGPVPAYRGAVPDAPHDATWVVAEGARWHAASGVEPDAIGRMLGAEPVGFAGTASQWLVLQHGTAAAALRADGGRLDPPVLFPGSAVSVVDLGTATAAEADGGRLDPALLGAIELDDGLVAVGRDGFSIVVVGPPGSRVYFGSPDPSVVGGVGVVRDDGRAVMAVPLPVTSTPNPRFGVSAAVTTPGGRSYLAGWIVQLLTAPPALEATVTTRLASAGVEVRGTTEPYATVVVGGRAAPVDEEGRFSAVVDLPPWPVDVPIAAEDPVGNRAATSVSAIGWVDYRGLPWVPIGVALVAATAVFLFLRVPRSPQRRQPAAEDGVLEELDPDG